MAAQPEPEISAPLLAPSAEPEIGGLDNFGNLKGSGEQLYGFEIPKGADRNLRALAFPVYYVGANEPRILRFYRSRGHTLIKTMTSWTIAHSHRTLSDMDGAAPEAERTSSENEGATIVMTQGPGAGYTLRFHRASPAPPAKRPVELLVEAELKKDEGNEDAGSASGGPKGSSFPIDKLRREAFSDRPQTRKAVDLSQRIYKHMKANKSDRFRD